MRKVKWTYQKVNWKSKLASTATAPSAPSGSSTGAAPIAEALGTAFESGPPMAAPKPSDTAPPRPSSTPVAPPVTCAASADEACLLGDSVRLQKWAARRGETVAQAVRVILDEMREEYPEKSVWPVEDQVLFYLNQNVIHV